MIYTCPPQCNAPGLYSFKAKSFGPSVPLYVALMARVNGQFQQFPQGFAIPSQDVVVAV